MIEHYAEIAGITLCIRSEYHLDCPESFQTFIRKKNAVLWNIDLITVKQLPVLPEKLVYRQGEYAVFCDESDNIFRCFYDRLDDDRPYAVMEMDVVKRQVKIYYFSEKQIYFSDLGNTFFHIGWEKILACERRFILHAACVRTPIGGILFSGVSGIGKSTQAELWCRFAGGSLLNGDRTIIERNNGIWTAYGSPYAGSSKCYKNESCSIRSIVMLQKSKKCNIRRLEIGEAFRKIYAGTIVNSWDRQFVESICNEEAVVVAEVPVYELYCTPDRKAVQILWDTLERGI